MARELAACDELGIVSTVVEEREEKSGEKELANFTSALQRLREGLSNRGVDLGESVLARALVGAAGHTGQHYWTNLVNRELANEILTTVCTICGHSNYQSLLAVNESLLATILDYLKKVLTKSSWKHYPVHKQSLVWVVTCLKHPSLAPQLPLFLPPTLWMLDDYSDYHRVLALSIISHVLLNVDHTELRWQGTAQLLYQAIEPLLYVSSSRVVSALHPCLLKLFPVLDYSTCPTIPVKAKTIDKVFRILLDFLAKESKISLRRVYTSQLKGYILELGIFSVRHIKQCLPVLLLSLEHCDPDEEVHCLQALSSLISSAWPRIPSHKMAILKALSKVVNSELLTRKQDILCLVVECLTLLMRACPELKEGYHWLEKSCSHETMQYCLQQTFLGAGNSL